MKTLHKSMQHFTVVLLVLIFTYQSYVNAANNCTQWQTCDECIRYSQVQCAWCSAKDYVVRDKEPDRCDLQENHIKQKCGEIANPAAKVLPTQNDDLTNTTKVKPQRIEISLRPGQTRSFDISVLTPENYPVDVYMLMDMSYSMKENLPSVERLGALLAVEMKTITSRFRVGFGTMVDKPLAPFKEPNQDYFENKINTLYDGRHIVSPWIYKNVLALTEDSTEFEASVKRQNLSESVDIPDGWPDTLMQVAVCEKAVGWQDKDKARRLVVISTEELFHIAGDGLLGGIVTPNDGTCKLSGNTYLGKKMDYPSLPHLRQVMAENAIVPIFAVAPNSLGLYQAVVKYFGDEIGARVGMLEANSTNIVRLIRDTYEEIGKTQTIFHSADGIDNIKVEYTAECSEVDASGRKCVNVPIGKKVTFKVSITLESCPASGKGFAEFNITTALGDKVPVRVNYLCECNCTASAEGNSTQCSGEGNYQCGNCYCKPGVTGEKCDCPDSKKIENKEKCIAPNETVVCSNRGACECGKCACIKSKTSHIDGKYCQCSNTNCDRDENGELCGGSDRGECVCNKCQCKGEWSGPFCGCSNDTSACFEKNVECSGKGKCECNKCVCRGQYTGKLCEKCDGCTKGCSFYKDCVRCKTFNTGPYTQNDLCERNCQYKNNTFIKTVDNVDEYKTEVGTKCITVDDEDDCTIVYVLNETDEDAEIFVSEEKNCPREEGYLIIIIGVILGIVAIGAALLLIWKLLATIQDRREFAKFEREKQNARWDTSENPIFKQATTTFQNPTYGGKS